VEVGTDVVVGVVVAVGASMCTVEPVGGGVVVAATIERAVRVGWTVRLAVGDSGRAAARAVAVCAGPAIPAGFGSLEPPNP
jgi:hypothetical protein